MIDIWHLDIAGAALPLSLGTNRQAQAAAAATSLPRSRQRAWRAGFIGGRRGR